ncbi:MAG: ATP-binding cassette domain-containing protein [Lachnospiraceae bacterium]|jgi:lincosamide and streptogramin A transport system ATP-binding/permease protein|nr:ATP-binding cassette domain-containing protein [Lachnospiraceae bacterium]
MSLISIQNLTFSYPNEATDVFKDVNLNIDTSWKLGLVGRNGRGKTTLLNLLMGKYEYSGRINVPLNIQYFPFEVTDKGNLALFAIQEIFPDIEEWRVKKECNLLELKEDSLYLPFSSLSFGERTKLMLAALFSLDDTFLLIDEPTNHLDIHGRGILASYLNSKSGFILVSHDRWVLDKCVDHIISINKEDISVSKGNFSTWEQQKTKVDQLNIANDEKLRKDIGRLTNSTRRASSWSDKTEKSKLHAPDRGFMGHKAAKMMSKAKNIEDRRNKALEDKKGLLNNIETTEKLQMFPLEYSKSNISYAHNLQIKYGDKTIFALLNFEINNGDRIALVGNNGSGKSSILKLILHRAINNNAVINNIDFDILKDEYKLNNSAQFADYNFGIDKIDTSQSNKKNTDYIKEDLTDELNVLKKQMNYNGDFSVSGGLKIAYLSQNTKFLIGNMEEYIEKLGIEKSLFYTVLSGMYFEEKDFNKNMEDLSEGQRKKVALASNLCQKAHLYIWDEPLNYIDILSRKQIEDLILTSKPTIIFVEHDKEFIEIVSNKIVEIK